MLCPRCERRTKVIETVKEGKRGKRWLITSCASCRYNFEIEEWKKPYEPEED